MPQGAPFGFVLQASRRVGRWVQHKAAPQLHRSSEAVIQALTREQGRSQWTALTPSRRWSGVIIWTLVSVAGFGLVWASFARIDETVQAMGKLEPKGSTLDVKAPMGGVIKDILAKEGDVVDKDQVLIEMDPTAARARDDCTLHLQRCAFATRSGTTARRSWSLWPTCMLWKCPKGHTPSCDGPMTATRKRPSVLVTHPIAHFAC